MPASSDVRDASISMMAWADEITGCGAQLASAVDGAIINGDGDLTLALSICWLRIEIILAPRAQS